MNLLSALLVVSHFLSTKLPPKRLKPGFGTQKKCPFLLNRGVSSIRRYQIQDYVISFPRPNFVSEWRCPLNSGVSKERFQVYLDSL